MTHLTTWYKQTNTPFFRWSKLLPLFLATVESRSKQDGERGNFCLNRCDRRVLLAPADVRASLLTMLLRRPHEDLAALGAQPDGGARPTASRSSIATRAGNRMVRMMMCDDGSDTRDLDGDDASVAAGASRTDEVVVVLDNDDAAVDDDADDVQLWDHAVKSAASRPRRRRGSAFGDGERGGGRSASTSFASRFAARSASAYALAVSMALALSCAMHA